jgi:hypothetical protein
MSKKLIAVASAAALALTGLVGVAPASAAPWSVTETGGLSTGGDGSTATAAVTILVPSQDVLRYDTDAGLSTTATLVRYAVVTPAADASITVNAEEGVKLLTSAQFDELDDQTTASGASTLPISSGSGATVNFYAYSTSTSAKAITVTSGSNSSVIYQKGISAKTNSYKLNFSASSTSAAGGDIEFTGTVTDMFGNKMTLTNADLSVDGVGGNLAAGITTTNLKEFDVNDTTKVHTFAVTNRDSVGSGAMSLILEATALATKVTAFGSLTDTQFFNVSALDLSAQVTALTAQVGALQAQLEASRPMATSVTKKRYNTLARKWNAANPGSRVALKK